LNFTSTSLCPWVGHPVSGLWHTTYALLRLGFPTASYLKYLTLLHTITRWPVLQKVRGYSNIELPLLVGIGFQVLFHSPPGVLFTFPSRYYFSIGHQVVFSLGRWSSLLPTGFLVSRGTLEHNLDLKNFAYRTFTFYSRPFQAFQLFFSSFVLCPQPQYKYWFGLFPLRSPLLRESIFLSLPQGT
jgi:hypothetical protein